MRRWPLWGSECAHRPGLRCHLFESFGAIGKDLVEPPRIRHRIDQPRKGIHTSMRSYSLLPKLERLFLYAAVTGIFTSANSGAFEPVVSAEEHQKERRTQIELEEVSRGAHELAAEVTEAFANVRQEISLFYGAYGFAGLMGYGPGGATFQAVMTAPSESEDVGIIMDSPGDGKSERLDILPYIFLGLFAILIVETIVRRGRKR